MWFPITSLDFRLCTLQQVREPCHIFTQEPCVPLSHSNSPVPIGMAWMMWVGVGEGLHTVAAGIHIEQPHNYFIALYGTEEIEDIHEATDSTKKALKGAK